MNGDARIQSLELVDAGKSYKATYYVEHCVLHVNLAGTLHATVCMNSQPAEMVRALLAERILQISARQHNH